MLPTLLVRTLSVHHARHADWFKCALGLTVTQSTMLLMRVKFSYCDQIKFNERVLKVPCKCYGCVAFRTISLPSFNGFCSKLTKIALFIYLMYCQPRSQGLSSLPPLVVPTMYCLVECMTSSVISLAYFSHFSNFNICGTKAAICKR